jgi:hypothetical protein
MISRNDTEGFAIRTTKNLKYIEAAYDDHEDVHVVTQVVNSLLGLIVFPWEHDGLEHVRANKLSDLEKEGWPQFKITKGQSADLGDLVYHLRNAVAHGHMIYSSDSRNENEVTIEIEDYKPKAPKPYWCAHIGVDDLHVFVLKLADEIKDTVG